MSIFNWEEFNLGLEIASIDNQHKELFAIINKLYDIAESDDIFNDLKKVIKELHDYTEYHFSTEIEYLIKFDYPKIDEHKKLHKAFTDEIAKYEELAAENKLKPADCANIFNYLVKWLTMHIDKVDRDYATFIKKL